MRRTGKLGFGWGRVVLALIVRVLFWALVLPIVVRLWLAALGVADG
jgi:hypothetical protein